MNFLLGGKVLYLLQPFELTIKRIWTHISGRFIKFRFINYTCQVIQIKEKLTLERRSEGGARFVEPFKEILRFLGLVDTLRQDRPLDSLPAVDRHIRTKHFIIRLKTLFENYLIQKQPV